MQLSRVNNLTLPIAGFAARVRDLDRREGAGALNADPAIAYPDGQALARDVLGSGGNGIVYPSARRVEGQCLVTLRPHPIQNVRQGDTWIFAAP